MGLARPQTAQEEGHLLCGSYRAHSRSCCRVHQPGQMSGSKSLVPTQLPSPLRLGTVPASSPSGFIPARDPGNYSGTGCSWVGQQPHWLWRVLYQSSRKRFGSSWL